MNISIGENIKKLRNGKDITQEELGSYLGVTFQAISKWERGDVFPDITMLPALSNFFGVSIDELIGMNQIKDRENLNKIFKLIQDLRTENKHQEAIELMMDSLKTYPTEYGLMSELALTLSLNDENIKPSNMLKEEAIELSERILVNSLNEKVKSTTRANLCFLYKDIGNIKKAQDLARTLPHIWESREILQIELLSDSEYIDALKKMIIITLSIICTKIDNIKDRNNYNFIIKDMIASGPRIKKNISDCKYRELDKIIDFLDLSN